MTTRLILLTSLPLLLWLTTGCVGRLFYYPDRRVYQTPAEKNLRYEEVTFRSKDGTRLSGWFIPAKGTPVGTVIHFHGNAQNMTAHFSFVDWLPAEGYNLFTFDYRGYGKSEGSPDRQGLYEDCRAALDYLRSRPDIDRNALLILGQSLGGANAIAVVGDGDRDGIRAVAIESTFFSYRSVVRDKIGAIPLLGWFKWPLSYLVIGNGHSPGDAVGGIAPLPLLLIHGDADQVIPYHHAQWLYAKAGEPKLLWTVKGGGHTEALINLEYRSRLLQFYREALGRQGGR